MNKNESIRDETADDVIELGVASIETRGGIGHSEVGGLGGPVIPGISEE